MADDAVDTPDVEAPEQGGGEGDSELASARASFEGRAAEAGLIPAEPDDRPAEPVRTRRETAPSRDEGEPRRKSPQEAYQERVQREASQRQLLAIAQIAERAQREEAARQGRPAQQEAAPGTTPEAAGNPYDPYENYVAWDEWNRQALKDSMLAALDERLKPILEDRERQEAEYRQRQELAQRQQEDERYFQERSAIARIAHETYIDSPEGAEYPDRLAWYVGEQGHPGDPERGIPAREARPGSVEKAWLDAGFPPEMARSVAMGGIRAVQVFAEKYGLNPAEAMDRMMRSQLLSALDYLGISLPDAAIGNGNGHGRPAPPAAPPSPARQRARETRRAVDAAAPVRGSMAETAQGTKRAGLLARVGRGEPITLPEMREYAIEMYGKADAVGIAKVSKLLREQAAKMGG